MRIRESLRHANFSIPRRLPLGCSESPCCRKDSNSTKQENVVRFEMTKGGFELFHWNPCHGLKTSTKTEMNYKIISRYQQIVYNWCWIPIKDYKVIFHSKDFSISLFGSLRLNIHIINVSFLLFLLPSHTFLVWIWKKNFRKYSDKSQ